MCNVSFRGCIALVGNRSWCTDDVSSCVGFAADVKYVIGQIENPGVDIEVVVDRAELQT